MDEQTINLLSKLVNQSSTVNNAFYASIGSSIASILVCCITVYFNFRQTMKAKQKEYIDDYYKYIVKRRIAAYEQLEKLIASIKCTAADSDQKAYHLIFSSEEDILMEYKMLLSTTNDALWLSEAAFDASRRLNYILLEFDPTKIDTVSFGKKNYEQVANLREKLEKILAQDMLELHNVKKFLNEKKKRKSEFIPIKVAHSTDFTS